LAHHSYIVGDGGEAVVIDPRRDAEVYVDLARRHGCRITSIFETHRNEDYVVGSAELAARTGADVWHADGQLDYKYGAPAEPGQTWGVGRYRIEALHTPGHTPNGRSYLLRDTDGSPWTVFTGDTLFAGEVGRTDLVDAARSREMAGLLHDSLFGTLLPLGDEVIVAPGHGAGSVCGAAIAQRAWTTIGIERRSNAKLQIADRDAFVDAASGVGDRPPYFRRVEVLNLEGAPLPHGLPAPPPLTPQAFAAAAPGAVVVDTRWETAFATAHVPGSLSLWLDGLPLWAGWLLDYDTAILLVIDGDDPEEAVRRLVRLGYDSIAGFLSGGMSAWHMAGLASAGVGTVTAGELCGWLDAGEGPALLDIRARREVASAGAIEGARQIPLGELPDRLREVPEGGRICVLCGAGLRSMTAASLLRAAGHDDVTVMLGGFAAWNSTTCPVRLEATDTKGTA
jgi:hydroxyacylglutathione hydrolase